MLSGNLDTVCIKVNKGSEHLADFTIEKTVYQLGDVVRGFVDFSTATIPSYFLSMKLELIEEVASEYFANHPARPMHSITKIMAENEENLQSTRSTNFEFQLPLNGTPTFATELVSVRWVLKCELVTSALKRSESTQRTLAPPPSEQTERLTWHVPIRVLVASYPISLLDQPSKANKEWIV